MVKWFRSAPVVVMGISILFGLSFWVIDGYFEFMFFHDNLSFLLLEGPETYLESIIFKVSPYSLFVRLSFIVGAIIGGVLVLMFINKRKKAEDALKKAHDKLEHRVAERTAELGETNIQLKQEVQERKRVEEQIKASLIEKEVLLSEVHHRVKNNFEIISSLLDMSSMQTENQEIQNLWGDARARIHSMALIHSQLYENDRFDQIDMERHIQDLVDHLSHVYGGTGQWITPEIEPSRVYLSVNQAIPCALLLNELIANAFKHAFRKRKKGTIQVSITNATDDTVLIRVKDDGDGISEGSCCDSANGLGLKLVRHLVDGQLKGKMRFTADGGTEICIEFKKFE